MEYQIRKFNSYNWMNQFQRDKNYENTSIWTSDELLSGIEQANKSWISPIPPSSGLDKTVELSNFVWKLLGIKWSDDWILNLNIGNVMHLSPLTLQEMNLHLDNSHELTWDALLEKVILLAISYFCIGTELWFLAN